MDDERAEFRISSAELKTRYGGLYNLDDSSKKKDQYGNKRDINKFTLKDRLNQGAIHFEYDEDKKELNLSTMTFKYPKKFFKEDKTQKQYREPGNFAGTLTLYDIDTGKTIGVITFEKNGAFKMDKTLKDEFDKGEFSTTIKVNGHIVYTPKEIPKKVIDEAQKITAPLKRVADDQVDVKPDNKRPPRSNSAPSR